MGKKINNSKYDFLEKNPKNTKRNGHQHVYYKIKAQGIGICRFFRLNQLTDFIIIKTINRRLL